MSIVPPFCTVFLSIRLVTSLTLVNGLRASVMCHLRAAAYKSRCLCQLFLPISAIIKMRCWDGKATKVPWCYPTYIILGKKQTSVVLLTKEAFAEHLEYSGTLCSALVFVFYLSFSFCFRIVLVWGHFWLLGIFGTVWGHFWLSQLESPLLAFSG